MKVALIGYGQMGKTIERFLLERNHEVVARFGKEGINKEELAKADVAIEFSLPEVAFENLKTCAELAVPVVCGTTGWLQRYNEVCELTLKNKSALLYASNFSLGVNILFEINTQLARIMDAYPQYDISMQEIHHTRKLDAPSGTAITLAEQLITNINRKDHWTLEKPKTNEIQIDAVREADVPGTHSITYNSPIDSIEIKHTAHNREGFALGAVIAAEFLNGKQGVFSMKDVLNF